MSESDLAGVDVILTQYLKEYSGDSLVPNFYGMFVEAAIYF